MSSATARDVFHVQAVQYMDAVCLTILVVDYAITYKEEVDFVWKSRWSTIKALYTVSRYTIFLPIIFSIVVNVGFNLTTSVCKSLGWISAGFLMCSIAASEAILVFRTLAIWDNNRKLRFWLLLLYLLKHGAAIPVFLLFVGSTTCNHVRVNRYPIPSHDSTGSYYMYATMFLMMLVEIVLMSLLIYRIIKFYSGCKNHLLRTLYLDGVIFFIYITGITICNIVAFAVFPPALKNIFENLHYILHSVFACRIILDIRKADAVRHHWQTSGEILEPIRFTHETGPGMSLLTDADIEEMDQGVADE